MGSCVKQTNGGGLALRKCWEPCYGMKPCHGTGHPMMFKILSKGVFFVVRLGGE